MLQNIENQIVPCKSTAEEVLFETGQKNKISLTDLKVRTTLHVSIIDCGSERVQAPHKALDELIGFFPYFSTTINYET